MHTLTKKKTTIINDGEEHNDGKREKEVNIDFDRIQWNRLGGLHEG